MNIKEQANPDFHFESSIEKNKKLTKRNKSKE
jgi:hypothetical protein